MDSKKKVIKTAIYHKDRFFERYGFQQQRGQKQFSDAIVKNFLLKTGKNLSLCVARQSGKTTGNVWTAMWLLLFGQQFWEEMGYELTGLLEVGWGAPQFQQAKTGFDRLKYALERVKNDYKLQYDEANGNTLSINIAPYKSVVYVFPVTKGSKIESKSLQIFFGDEAQFFDDERLKMAVLPMLASTNGCKVFSGTSGYNLCYFYQLLNSVTPINENFVFDAYDIIEQKNEMYTQTGNPEYLNYEKHFLNEVTEHGRESDYIQTQYLLKWKLERGMYITPQKMMKMCLDVPVIREDRINNIMLGIDCAKSSDSTVAVATRWEMFKRPEWTEAKKCLRILDWYVVNKELYSDQWEILQEEFLNNYNVWKLNIDGTGPGDGTGDWFLKQYDKVNYDKFELREKNGRRGIVRPIKFTSQAKNKMYKELQKYIDNDLIIVPNDRNGVGFNKFLMESRILMKEYKGDLLSVHHDDSAGATDDCWDSLASIFYDIDLEPITSGIKVATFKQSLDISEVAPNKITSDWLDRKIKGKQKSSIDRL